MKKQVYHEGYNYVLEYDNNSLIMYKEDIDELSEGIETALSLQTASEQALRVAKADAAKYRSQFDTALNAKRKSDEEVEKLREVEAKWDLIKDGIIDGSYMGQFFREQNRALQLELEIDNLRSEVLRRTTEK
jgi:hypothetical protein